MNQGDTALSAVSESSRPVYYGWWVLGAGAITEMLAIGSTSYAAGLFVLPLERELSLSRAAASSARREIWLFIWLDSSSLATSSSHPT